MNKKTITSDCCNAPVEYFGSDELSCTKCGFICDARKINEDPKVLLADLHQIFYDETKIEISLEIDLAIRKIRDAVIKNNVEMSSIKEDRPQIIKCVKKNKQYSLINKLNEIIKAINWLLKK